MTHLACLHIQARNSNATRVVDLRGGTVRIGRAAFCDVRLAGPEFSGEECQLRHRGGAWHLHPVNPRLRSILHADSGAEGPVRLELGETFVVGTTRFTLQPAAEAVVEDRPSRDAFEQAAGLGASRVEARHGEWTARSDRHNRWLQSRLETKRWEARWKAAGEKLKASPTRPAGGVQAHGTVAAAASPSLDVREQRRRAAPLRKTQARPTAPPPRTPVVETIDRQEESVGVVPSEAPAPEARPAWLLSRTITPAGRPVARPWTADRPSEPAADEWLPLDESDDEPSFASDDRPILGVARRMDAVEEPGLISRVGPFAAVFREQLESIRRFAVAADDPLLMTRHVAGTIEADEPAPEATASITPNAMDSTGLNDRCSSTRGEGDWPSVQDILTAQAKPHGSSRRDPTRDRRPLPTVMMEPAHWEVPVWAGWTPALALTLSLGFVGLFGAYAWAVDGYNAGVVTRRLAAEGPDRKPLPEGVSPGSTAWWRTSPRHLMQWASLLDRRSDGAVPVEEANWLVREAGRVSPLDPSARYALSQSATAAESDPASSLAMTLGQPRDIVSLTKSGHQLLKAGRKPSALAAYQQAIEMAAHADAARPGVPEFLEGLEVRRYALPSESLLAYVIGDMAASDAWTFAEWSHALPAGTAAPMVAARLLTEKGSPDAEPALAAAIGAMPGVDEHATPTSQALQLASQGALLTMARRWDDAREKYQAAIERMPVEAVRRAWWMNVAHLAMRTNDDTTVRLALESAKNADPKDEITRRAVVFQKAPGYLAHRPVARKDSAVAKVAGTRP